MTEAGPPDAARPYQDVSFFELMPELSVPLINVIDVGANPTGYTPVYAPLMAAKRAFIYGFEADETAYAELIAKQGPMEQYLRYIIGDGEPCTFYNTAHPWMSSIYEPDMEVLEHFFWYPENGKVISTESGQTTRLDEIAEIETLDFFRLDIQGAELKACKGALNKLRGTGLVVQAETLFSPLYKGQPLFSELEIYLRKLGFMFLRFQDIQERSLKPLAPHGDWEKGYGYMLYADSVFVRDYRSWQDLGTPELLKLAAILHSCYGAYDFVRLAMTHLDQRHQLKAASLYEKRIKAIGVPH